MEKVGFSRPFLLFDPCVIDDLAGSRCLNEVTQTRGEEGRRPDREPYKRRGGPQARPGAKQEARRAAGATGTQTRGEEGRRRDRDLNKRRGGASAPTGKKKWYALGDRVLFDIIKEYLANSLIYLP